MDDAALIERLTAVRGIGRWTVEMLLMFRLGRPDVLPVDDYGIRKGFAMAFRKPEPARSDVGSAANAGLRTARSRAGISGARRNERDGEHCQGEGGSRHAQGRAAGAPAHVLSVARPPCGG